MPPKAAAAATLWVVAPAVVAGFNGNPSTAFLTLRDCDPSSPNQRAALGPG
eukprot:gene8997-8131_t